MYFDGRNEKDTIYMWAVFLMITVCGFNEHLA